MDTLFIQACIKKSFIKHVCVEVHTFLIKVVYILLIEVCFADKRGLQIAREEISRYFKLEYFERLQLHQIARKSSGKHYIFYIHFFLSLT